MIVSITCFYKLHFVLFADLMRTLMWKKIKVINNNHITQTIVNDYKIIIKINIRHIWFLTNFILEKLKI